MKQSVKKTLRNTLISIVVLLFVVAGGGLLYTWVIGKTQPPQANVGTVEPQSQPVIKHVQPATNVPESASIQSLTTPIAPGDNASVTIKTNPKSTCVISVIYDKTPSTDSGLSAKTSDEYGTVTWSWTVENTVPIGKWPVKITCTREKLSAVVIGDLVIARP